MNITDRLLEGQALQNMNGLLVQKDLQPHPFETIYIRIRKDEDRIHTQEEIRLLPNVRDNHPYSKEWGIRAWSANHLTSYFRFRSKHLRIAEIGCGNGWLSGFLASQLKADVVGIDCQRTELEQAVRAFDSSPNLCFVQTDVMRGDALPKEFFDVIILAASAQYFPDLPALLNTLLTLLKTNGEIHIVDTPIYKDDERSDARQRSETYFKESGTPEMIDYYFHHSWHAFDGFHYKVMYSPKQILNRIRRSVGLDLSPFPWIRVTK